MKIVETFLDIINKNRNNILQNDKGKKFQEIVDYLNNNFVKNKSLNDKNIVNFFLYFDILFKEKIMQKNFEKKFPKLNLEKLTDININNKTNNNNIITTSLKKTKDKTKEKEKEKIETPELIYIKIE